MDLASSFFFILTSCASIFLSIVLAKLIFSAVSDGGSGEGTSEKRLKVARLKSVRKTAREGISGQTVLVSEFKAGPEPVVADDGLGCSEERNLENTCCADQLCGAQEKDDCFGVNEGLILGEEVEGFEFRESGLDERMECKEEELGSCVLNQRGEVKEEISERDDSVDLGLYGGENGVGDDQRKHRMVLESVETTTCVDDEEEETRSSVSKENVDDDDQHEQDEGTGSSVVSKEYFGGENRVDDDDRHKHHVILDYVENYLKEAIQEAGVGGENRADDDRHLHHMVSESVETDCNREACVDDQDEEARSSVSKEDVLNRDEEGRIGDGEEEWEGIERNELDRDFAKAANFVECGNKEGQLNKLGSDVIMQFYGLQKVAMEGPCYEPAPMALKRFARAKWNAWQKLGSMNPDEAMKNYINLLSDKVPGWMGPSVEGKISSEEDGACKSSDANLGTTLTLTCIDDSKPGEEPVMGAGDLTGNSSSVNTGVE